MPKKGSGQTEGMRSSEPPDRNRRTSKHRAPQRAGQPPQRRPKPGIEVQPTARQTSMPAAHGAPDFFSRRTVRFGFALVVVLVLIFGFIGMYRYMTGSRFFELRQIDVYGNSLVSDEEIDQVVRSIAKRKVLSADITEIRNELKKNELIKEVEIARVLPDMMRVIIKERTPSALARRRDGSVVCVDTDGSLFGNRSLFKTTPSPPLISGLKEEHAESALEINRRRIETYEKLIAELKGSPEPLIPRIEEINFDDDQGARIILADSRIVVVLGNEDFRKRLNAALDLLDAVRRGDAEHLNVLRIGDAEKLLSGAKIAYLNATIPNRVVVGLEE
jgi:cell division septal protein FtsQ